MTRFHPFRLWLLLRGGLRLHNSTRHRVPDNLSGLIDEGTYSCLVNGDTCCVKLKSGMRVVACNHVLLTFGPYLEVITADLRTSIELLLLAPELLRSKRSRRGCVTVDDFKIRLITRERGTGG